MEAVSEHVTDLLALRNQSEEKYRRQVMRLIGAFPLALEDDPPLLAAMRRRRVEGTVKLHCDDTTKDHIGLVMFALGKDGEGARADIRSKDGLPAAKSLLAAEEAAEFILVITTGYPAAVLEEEAINHSGPMVLCGQIRDDIWLIGLPEIVTRSVRFLEVQRQEDEFWNMSWWRRLFTRRSKDIHDHPSSPLLLNEPAA